MRRQKTNIRGRDLEEAKAEAQSAPGDLDVQLNYALGLIDSSRYQDAITCIDRAALRAGATDGKFPEKLGQLLLARQRAQFEVFRQDRLGDLQAIAEAFPGTAVGKEAQGLASRIVKLRW